MTPPRRAFTILELIVTIGIIALLASLVVVALGGVRRAANRAESTGALRNMVLAYAAYSSDYNQQLMPGAIAPDALAPQTGYFRGLDVRVDARISLDLATFEGRQDAGPYVWRLAPYLDYAWKTYVVDYRNRELLGKFSSEYEAAIYGQGSAGAAGADKLGIGFLPSFGMNSIFVGGDNVHGGAGVIARNPWTPADSTTVLAATRLSEVRNPARLIVFAPSVHWGELDDEPGNDLPVNELVTNVDFGSTELRPPMLDWDDGRNPLEQQWAIDGATGRIVPLGEFDADGGYPIARWGQDELPVGRLDGSVETRKLFDLQTDLRSWSPRAVGF